MKNLFFIAVLAFVGTSSGKLEARERSDFVRQENMAAASRAFEDNLPKIMKKIEAQKQMQGQKTKPASRSASVEQESKRARNDSVQNGNRQSAAAAAGSDLDSGPSVNPNRNGQTKGRKTVAPVIFQ